MIRRIGIICQDQISFGFLKGLRNRLGCEAELVEPPVSVGMSRNLTRRQARNAWESFKNKQVDLVVRFTDADGKPWQKVRSAELEVFPAEARSILVCGVAVENVEHWLCLDSSFLTERLELRADELLDDEHRTSRIKSAIARRRNPGQATSDFVDRLVSEAPETTFKDWLTSDEAFRTFYNDCRSSAIRDNCDVPNEQ